MQNLKTHGRFISLEGIEGVGKTTQVSFIQRYLMARNIPVLVTREPGGTLLAEEIRRLLLHFDRRSEYLFPETELLLLFAARAQHIKHVVRPALQRGQWVLCDRFTEASYAYQGGGRGIDLSHIDYLQQWIQKGLSPDCILLLDAPVGLAFERKQAPTYDDHIESESQAFFARVRAMYLARAQHLPQRYRVIDASASLTSVQQQIIAILAELGVAP